MRQKVGKSWFTVFFQWFVAPEGRKVGSLKRRVRSQLARGEIKKLHAVVARSTFPSQNVKNTRGADHFWELRCRKSARRCGAKHISKSKCTKHTIVGPLLEVAMSKKCTPLWREAHFKSKCTKHTIVGPLLEVAMSRKCTPLWREAHFQVKMYKTHHCRTTFGSCNVEKVHAVVARSTFRSQNVQNTRCSDHFWRVRMSKKCMPLWREGHFEIKMFKTLGVRTSFGGSDVASLHYTTLHYTTLHYTTRQDITLHYITIHYTPVHSSTLHYTKLHYTTLHRTTLHYTEWHCTTDRQVDR